MDHAVEDNQPTSDGAREKGKLKTVSLTLERRQTSF